MQCRLVILLAIICCVLGGCAILAVQDPSGWGYVHRQGGPDRITEWALRQTDPDRIAHAQLALSQQARWDNGVNESTAIAGVISIHNKLKEGWPRFRGSPELIEDCISSTYSILAFIALDNDSAAARQAFYSVEPSHKESSLREVWYRMKAELDERWEAIDAHHPIS